MIGRRFTIAALMVTPVATAVRARQSPDWADYLHYGDPLFELKAASPD